MDILCVALNGVFQKTLTFGRLRPGHVNRAETRTDGVGGKGQNFAVACQQYGRADKVTVLQLVGGATGEYVKGKLEAKGIRHVSVQTPNDLRTCVTLLDHYTREMTEIVEPGTTIPESCRAELEDVTSHLLAQNPKAISLCGTLPRGITGETYASIARRKPPACLLLLDGVKDVIGSLETGNIDICKVNVEELNELVRGSEKTADAAGRRAIPALARRLREAYPVKILGVTDGPRNAFLFEFGSDGRAGRCSEYELPNLPELAREIALAETRGQETAEAPFLNPLGAGDTANAVMLIDLLEGKDPVDAFRAALAAASASCFVLDKSSHFSIETMRHIESRIVVASREM